MAKDSHVIVIIQQRDLKGNKLASRNSHHKIKSNCMLSKNKTKIKKIKPRVINR